MSHPIYTEEVIKTKISTDTRWTIRTLELLYHRQTVDEQSDKTTKWKNGMGFNGRDGEILTSFFQQVIKRREYNNPVLLSDKQMRICQKILPKYWKQVLEEIEKKEKEE